MTEPTRSDPAPRRRRAAGATAVPATEAAPAQGTAAGEAPVGGPEEPRRPGLPARDARSGALDDRDALELARRVVDLAADKKAADIVLLGVGSLTSLADYFVICSGGSERQLGAIADGISEGMREIGVRPIGREGVAGAHWVLLDFGAVIVHIFAAPERDFYQLERLWADAPTLLRVQ